MVRKDSITNKVALYGNVYRITPNIRETPYSFNYQVLAKAKHGAANHSEMVTRLKIGQS